MKIILNDINYELERDDENSFDLEEVKSLFTDYFNDFDYVLGDWSYGKLRLKGFCKRSNAKFKQYNNYEKMEKYVDERCPLGCKFFILKKLKNKS